MVLPDPRQHAGPPRILTVDTAEHLANQAALEFHVRAKAAVEQRGSFAVALSGGSTPKAMLQLLATPEWQDRIDWPRVHVYWGDERCVPADSANSNYGMARGALLDHVPVVAENVHPMRGELDPRTAAEQYEHLLRGAFPGDATFDLVFLGLGLDGHTASLFPGTPALAERDRLCVANEVESAAVSPWRLTLTYPAINRSRAVIFLVEGAAKAGIVQRVLEEPRHVDLLPAQGVAPRRGTLTWLLDAPAAARLKKA